MSAQENALRAAAAARLLDCADRAAAKPSRRDIGQQLRVLADQIQGGPNVVHLLAEAGAACLLGLETALAAEDRMRRTPLYTHAAMSAQAMENNDG